MTIEKAFVRAPGWRPAARRFRDRSVLVARRLAKAEERVRFSPLAPFLVHGSAGSATLVFQIVLPALLTASGKSRIVFEGGTHNTMAPPFECIAHTFLPLVQRMGATVSAALVRAGFYPAGGGRFEMCIEGGAALQPLELLERGSVHSLRIKAVVSRLPERIAEREVKVLASALADFPIEMETARIDSAGPGNVASVTVCTPLLTETFTAFGEVAVRAEQVAYRLARQVRTYLQSGAPVGEHLADQLLIPCALAGSGTFRTTEPSLHTRTNAEVIGLFLRPRVTVAGDAGSGWTVNVREEAEPYPTLAGRAVGRDTLAS